MNKNGSLELSVNAIVVLILAITMLGLGLGFMKGMFGKVSQNVDTAIGQNQLTNPPTVNNPFTLSSNQISLARGATQTITLAYYNEGNGDVDFAPEYGCSPVDVTGTPTTFASRKVSPGGNVAWQLLLKASSTAISGTKIQCFFNTSTSTSTIRYADLFVEIN